MMNWGTGLFLVWTCGVDATASGQYFLGFRGGLLDFACISEAGRGAVDNTSGGSLGLIFVQKVEEGVGFRFALDGSDRRYDLDLLNLATNRREQLRMRTILLQFSSEVRFPVAPAGWLYLDFGPVIGARVSERGSGISYNDGAAGLSDTLLVDGPTEVGFQIRDVRLRVGLSTDVPITDRLLVSMQTSISPGWSGWFRGRGFTTVDGQLAIGVVYSGFDELFTKRDPRIP